VEDRTVAEDRYQENLEIVKLRIAFMQHLTTLSGAATLIVLAILQRTEEDFLAWELGVVLALFGVATLLCVSGAARLINQAQTRGRELENSAGQRMATLGAAVFAAAVVSLMVAGFRIPLISASVIMFALVVGSWVLPAVLSSGSAAPPDEAGSPEKIDEEQGRGGG
jgi:hypothetical protein